MALTAANDSDMILHLLWFLLYIGIDISIFWGFLSRERVGWEGGRTGLVKFPTLWADMV